MSILLDIMVFSAGVGILLALTGWKDKSEQSLEGEHTRKKMFEVNGKRS